MKKHLVHFKWIKPIINKHELLVIRIILVFGMLILNGKEAFAQENHFRTFVNVNKDWKNVNLSLNNANFFDFEGKWFLYHFELLADFKSEKSISFGIGYKQEYVKFPDRVRIEYRPKINMYYTKKWGNLKFRDRSRLEARFFDHDNINRYRNQMLFIYEKFDKVKPYILTEFWFRLKGMEYFRQESIIGLQFPFKAVDISVFYGQWNNESSPDDWEFILLPGVALTFKI